MGLLIVVSVIAGTSSLMITAMVWNKANKDVLRVGLLRYVFFSFFL